MDGRLAMHCRIRGISHGECGNEFRQLFPQQHMRFWLANASCLGLLGALHILKSS